MEQVQHRNLKLLPEGDSPKGIALTHEDLCGEKKNNIPTQQDLKELHWGDESLFCM